MTSSDHQIADAVLEAEGKRKASGSGRRIAQQQVENAEMEVRASARAIEVGLEMTS